MTTRTEPEGSRRAPRPSAAERVLVLGIGNVLMGDEGVGVHVVRRLQELPLPEGYECLDGGTGSFQLLEPLADAARVVMIDATIDGQPPGSLTRLRPRFSADYPRTLTAHDIGLKDLLDAYYLLGEAVDVTLFTVSIEAPAGVSLELTPVMQGRAGEIAAEIAQEIAEEVAAPAT